MYYAMNDTVVVNLLHIAYCFSDFVTQSATEDEIHYADLQGNLVHAYHGQSGLSISSET